METDEQTTTSVGYTTRDLVIQVKATLEGFGSDIRDIRAEQATLRADVDALKTAQAVRSASTSTSTDVRRAAYALLVLAAYWFGPVIDKAITH